MVRIGVVRRIGRRARRTTLAQSRRAKERDEGPGRDRRGHRGVRSHENPVRQRVRGTMWDDCAATRRRHIGDSLGPVTSSHQARLRSVTLRGWTALGQIGRTFVAGVVAVAVSGCAGGDRTYTGRAGPAAPRTASLPLWRRRHDSAAARGDFLLWQRHRLLATASSACRVACAVAIRRGGLRPAAVP